MKDVVEQIRKFGWLAAEAGLLIVVLSVLLHIVLGEAGGAFVTSVAENTNAFLRGLPSGVVVGLGLVFFAYALIRTAQR